MHAAFTQPAREYPLIGQAALMKQMFDGDDLSETAARLIAASQAQPDNAEALLDLSTILLLRGDRDIGLMSQMQALAIKQQFRLQKGGKLRLLVLKTPGDFMANTPVEFLIQSSRISADVLYVAPDLPYPTSIDHDLVMVCISEGDGNVAALEVAEALVQQWQKPLINRPDEIPLITRDRVCELMDAIPGVYMPQNISVDRDQLGQVARVQAALSDILVEDQFPVLARPKGTHAGQGLEMLKNETAIDSYLARYTAETFYLAPFVDYRSADGQFRKYRIVFIQGQPFLCHMAISDAWMVHYLNAGMINSASKRAEEAEAMASFQTRLAARHQAAFQGIVDCLDLDYFGIDCAETPDGELLVFEVANAMVVHNMDPVEMFPYKKPIMDSVFDAFQALLFERVAGKPSGISGTRPRTDP